MSRHRFDHSVDHSDDTKDVSATARPQRIEVITGVERRRKWSAQEKAAIVAESLAEGAVVRSNAGIRARHRGARTAVPGRTGFAGSSGHGRRRCGPGADRDRAGRGYRARAR